MVQTLQKMQNAGIDITPLMNSGEYKSVNSLIYLVIKNPTVISGLI